jgi:hypothetical protein
MRSYSITTHWVNEAACCGQDGVALQQHFNQTLQLLAWFGCHNREDAAPSTLSKNFTATSLL